MHSIDTKTKRSLLEKILKSKEFCNSSTYSNLLTYLVNASLKQEIPKEVTIAIDIFNKDANFNSNEDPTIRVYISNLRKKIQKYYQNEGKHDKIRLELPKGHYGITFRHYRKRLSEFKKYSNRIIIAALLFVIILLSFSIYQLKKSNVQRPQTNFYKNNTVWTEMVESSKDLILVLGDPFFYWEYFSEDSIYRAVRDFTVQSMDDFKQLKLKYPDKKITKKLAWPYFAHNSIYGLPNIIPVFVQAGKSYFMEEASKITLKHIERNNIVFLGGTLTLGIFHELLENSPLDIDFKYDDVDIRIADKMFTGTGRKPMKTFKDYCLFLKVPVPGNNHMMIFTSDDGIGIRAATHYMTNETSLKELENLFIQEYSTMPQYFLVVFEVSGIELTDYKSSVAYFLEIDPNLKLW